ncbi:MAG: 1-deoxy-D-xylulose-5-phosphate synthase [Acidimicrobiales bacterium]|jgi:1-deoxy-D-xylulose-5-phosphate synthase
MAMGGLRPVVALYATFLSRAFDQANLDVGLLGLPVVFCLDRAGITGDDGPSHHGVLDMILLSKIPGMTILAPSSYQELQQMFEDALAVTDGPVAIRWAKTPAPHVGWDEVGRGLSARQVKAASDDRTVCLLGAGKMLAAVEEAADLLAADGIHATVWDPRCIRPLDVAMLDDAAGHRLVVTVEDGFREGGFGTGVMDDLSSRSPRTEVAVLGVPVAHHPHGKVDDLLASFGLDGPGVAATVRSRLG